MLEIEMNHIDVMEEIQFLRRNLEKLRDQHSQMLIFSDFCSTLLTVTEIEKATELTIEQMRKLVGGGNIKFVRKEPEVDIYAFYTMVNGEMIKQRLHRKELGRRCFFMYCKRIHTGNEDNPFLAVPIKYEGENIGAILLEDLDRETLKQVNLKMLELFALPTGLVFKNCLLLSQSLREKQIISEQHRKIKEDLQFAQKIQGAILPSGSKKMNRYRFYGELQQAHYLGGDVYDYFQADNKNIVFYMADVSGHGVGVSLLTVFLKHLIRGLVASFKNQPITPIRILRQIQERFSELKIEDDIYIGILMGVLDTENNIITIANGGHNVELLHIGGADNKGVLYEMQGLPINNWFVGITSDVYEEKKIYLDQGDKIILLTDGANEAKSQKGEMLGVERIKELFLSFKGSSEDTYFQRLIEKITEHMGREELEDDIAFLMIKRELEGNGR